MSRANQFALTPEQSASLARRGLAVPPVKQPGPTPDEKRAIRHKNRRRHHANHMKEWREKRRLKAA